MSDHPKVRGDSVTQLESTADIAGLRTGSTAGHDLCHDLQSSEEIMMTFHSEMGGEGGSIPLAAAVLLTPGHSQIRCCVKHSDRGGAPSPFELSLRMIYCVTSGMGPVYRQATEPNRWVRLVLLGSCQEIRELNVQY